MVKFRLHQFLSKSGLFSTKNEILDAIKSGKIRVSNEIVKDIDYRVDPKRKNVYYNDSLVRINRKLYFLFYKPKRWNCQKNQKKSVYNLIDQLNMEGKKSLFIVGRLDVDSSGLLIVTNDGLLSNKILGPNSNIKKTYEVTIDKEISNDDINKLRNGVLIDLEDRKYKTKPALVKKIDNKILVTISEGKKRQVRRMFGSLNYKVRELKRISIGELKLDNLNPKEFKQVTREEIYSKIFR